MAVSIFAFTCDNNIQYYSRKMFEKYFALNSIMFVYATGNVVHPP
jgi:hypothetical protein